MKIIFFIIFLLFVLSVKTFTIYLVPYNLSAPCNGNQSCDGTSSKPFDDIGYAFQYAASSCNCASLVFNLISTPNVPNNVFYFNGSTMTPFAPFDSFYGSLSFFHLINFINFQGNITIQGIANDLTTSLNAIIWLRSDNLVFNIQQSISFLNITIIGIDMNVGTILQSNPCSALPNPSACSCLNSTNYNDSILYNSNSICSINQNNIPMAKANAFLGFIQLGFFLFYFFK